MKHLINLSEKVALGAPLDKTRPELVDKMGQILSRNRRNSLILQGPKHSGLSVLVNSLIKESADGKFPKLKGRKFFEIDPMILMCPNDQSNVLLKMEEAISFQEKATELIERLKEDNCIAIINNTACFFEPTSDEDEKIAKTVLVFAKFAQEMGVQVIITHHSSGSPFSQLEDFFDDTPDYSKFNKALSKATHATKIRDSHKLKSFTKLVIEEQELSPSFLEILLGHSKYSEQVIRDVIEVANDISKGKSKVNTALDFFDILETELGKIPEKITAGDIEKIRTKYYGKKKTSILDITPDTKDQKIDFDKSLKDLKNKIYGQDIVIERMVTALKIGISPLRNKLKPVYSALFAGPTGTGKTFLAKSIAKEFNLAFLRIDTSQYLTYSIETLLGNSKGDGVLGDFIKENPNGSLILFDEIDKIDHNGTNQILDLLLPALDEGNLNLGSGKTVDVTKSVFIFTSNHASESFGKHPVGFGDSQIITDFAELPLSRKVNALSIFMRKEFLNRLDEIVVFNRISEETLEKIVNSRIESINAELAIFDSEILVSADAKKELAKVGYSNDLGARPLDKVIDQKIRLPLAQMFHLDELEGGTIRINVKGGEFTFER